MPTVNPTIYDVAEMAKTSITTVSRFLNTPDKVAAATRERIEQAMTSLSYVPQAEAVARARSGIRRIGVLSPFFTVPSFVQRLRGIHEALAKSHYDLITYSVDDYEQLRNYLSLLPVTGRIDGLIIISLPFSEKDVERFNQNGIPVVTIEVSNPKFSSIVIDNVAGGALAAEYLIGKGYRKLSFFGEWEQPEYSLPLTNERLEGFRDKASKLGCPLEERFLKMHRYGSEYNTRAARELLSANERPDAVFCASDVQAVEVMKVARKMGLRIPEDLAVIGFDDIDVADYLELTTISQSLDQSGSLAAAKLLEHMRDQKIPSTKVQLNLQIIERYTA